jgi:hypothetical protein
MPLAGPILGGLIQTQFLSQGFTGSQSVNLAMAIGNGIIIYIQASNFYQGQTVGVGTGAGVGTGFIQGIVGPVVGTTIYGMMMSKGLAGTKSLNLANAIGNAFATHIVMGIVTTTSTPVCVGSGFGKLQGLVGTAMGSSIVGQMLAMGLKGTKSIDLAMAIGDGICNSINLSGIITTVIAGGGYPPSPLSGVEFGKLV